jgi:hypothetical protein
VPSDLAYVDVAIAPPPPRIADPQHLAGPAPQVGDYTTLTT